MCIESRCFTKHYKTGARIIAIRISITCSDNHIIKTVAIHVPGIANNPCLFTRCTIQTKTIATIKTG